MPAQVLFLYCVYTWHASGPTYRADRWYGPRVLFTLEALGSLEGQFRVHSAWNSVCMRATPSHTLYARTPRRQLKQFQFTAMADRRARVLAFCREQRSQDRRRSYHRRLSVQRRRVLNLRMRRAVKQSVVLVLAMAITAVIYSAVPRNREFWSAPR